MLVLTRYYSPFGTHGVLSMLNIELKTIERPWDGNKRFISCIPEGIYNCHKHISKRHGCTFEIGDVPDRDYILFHKGNSSNDVKGCIAIGKSWCIYNNLPWVMDSYNGFNDFMEEMSGITSFKLEIRSFRPPSFSLDEISSHPVHPPPNPKIF